MAGSKPTTEREQTQSTDCLHVRHRAVERLNPDWHLEHDRADFDQKLKCPVLVLWGDENPLYKGVDIVEIWQERASNVRGHGTPSAHWQPEQIPDQVTREVTAFIDEHHV